jgi:hypothetical protein
VIEKLGALEAVKHPALAATMSHLAAAGRRMRNGRAKRNNRKSLLQLLIPGHVPAAPVHPDPVKLAVLAIDTVAGASMRASFTGTEVQVSAPDEATASILRKALAQTARTRATDRLIRVTVAS